MALASDCGCGAIRHVVLQGGMVQTKVQAVFMHNALEQYAAQLTLQGRQRIRGVRLDRGGANSTRTTTNHWFSEVTTAL